MLNGRMSAALTRAFDDQIRHAITELLDDAYQMAGARYDEKVGCNGFTFGTDLYQFTKFRFQGCGDPCLAPIPLGETANDLELRLKVGEFNVACHRVGSSADQDIAECFPSSSGGPGRLARLNVVQLELDLEWTGPACLPNNLVIAHLGNPENGLEAVYLAIPSGVSDSGKINAWLHTELIWRWDGADAGGPRSPVDLPPAVPIPDAEVRLREAASDAEDASS